MTDHNYNREWFSRADNVSVYEEWIKNAKATLEEVARTKCHLSNLASLLVGRLVNHRDDQTVGHDLCGLISLIESIPDTRKAVLDLISLEGCINIAKVGADEDQIESEVENTEETEE